jgi:hypothetical protein
LGVLGSARTACTPAPSGVALNLISRAENVSEGQNVCARVGVRVCCECVCVSVAA